jgi:hypothetical protein
MPTIFVAYPYRIPKEEYRSAFLDAAEGFDVSFDYADEEITNKHVLDKIAQMMERAEFSLFDITGWNPNVTLELGIAIGRGLNYYILWNPGAEHPEPPADLGGIDRIQYTTLDELRHGLRRLLTQNLGAPGSRDPTEISSPSLEVLGVEEYKRRAQGSKGDEPDLQVLFLRVRNNRKPSETRRATIEDASVLVTAYQGAVRVLRCSGNWIDLSTGHPLITPAKSVTVRPGHEIGIELAGKFGWQDDAYLAGQSDPPSLKPGPYVIKVEIAEGENELVTLEQRIYNHGTAKPLTWIA